MSCMHPVSCCRLSFTWHYLMSHASTKSSWKLYWHLYIGLAFSQSILCPVIMACSAMADCAEFMFLVWYLCWYIHLWKYCLVYPMYCSWQSWHEILYMILDCRPSGILSFGQGADCRILCVGLWLVLIANGLLGQIFL